MMKAPKVFASTMLRLTAPMRRKADTDRLCIRNMMSMNVKNLHTVLEFLSAVQQPGPRLIEFGGRHPLQKNQRIRK
jgi:hypothetical protein